MSLGRICDRIQNEDFRALLMHPISEEFDENVPNQNLFKPVMLRMFPNLKKISFCAWYPGKNYVFDALQLLSILAETKLPKSLSVIEIDGEQWLEDVFAPSVQKEFSVKKIKVDVKPPQRKEDLRMMVLLLLL